MAVRTLIINGLAAGWGKDGGPLMGQSRKEGWNFYTIDFASDQIFFRGFMRMYADLEPFLDFCGRWFAFVVLMLGATVT
ncbi:MAG: hypothetical protein WA213_00825 [Terriglobales bacterium]